jgi:hypothetical protein
MSGYWRRAIPGICCLAVFATAGCGDGTKSSQAAACRQGFDARAWRGTLAQRRHQSDVVVACKTLKGKDAQAVRALLGPADRHPARDVWWYDIGPVRDFNIDVEMLEVRFRNGHVTHVRHAEG